jgi:hypothetical protein
MGYFKRNSNVNEAKVIQVVAVESIAGGGVDGDPIHIVREYFSMDGLLLARVKGNEDLQLGTWKTEPKTNIN